MRFTKMQGAGNDYVYVDCFEQPPPERPEELARLISDRHYGVGGDGLILICPSDSADARMRIFNADGSEAEMCGNGVRCVAKYIYEHGIRRKEKLRVETGRGVLDLELKVADDKVRRVRVDMGEPILEAARIPVVLPDSVGQVVNLSGMVGQVDNLSYVDPRVTCVSMGNPHAVFYCRDVSSVPLERIGPHVERQPIFPRRINVHFVQVNSPTEATMRTWERGSGATLACGTGACAVCVAGVLTGRTERSLLAHLPGGDLELHWADDNHVYMTGDAVEVFSGQWPVVSGQ
ncbi:MAG: diaminopimelate epimerase [Pirellulales bacterium]|nr:diaminopimelate epimerase [Pirellulales bacterium]